MEEILRQLVEHRSFGPMVAHTRTVEGVSAQHAEPARPLHPDLRAALAAQGIERLYTHQARGLDLARAGRDVLVATPTASGKTLLFALCMLESVLEDPRSKALLLYPTKALAQDQLVGFRQLSGGLRALRPPRFEIYDGDTPASRRRKIRADPPQGLITNPDMLHLGILAHHEEWEPFFRDLRWIVLDELHVYRGIFGAHVHHILARLQRIAAKYGADPRFVAASATVGNPREFVGTLVGREFEVVSDSGAARAPLDVVFLNPVAVSPYTVTVRLVAELAQARRRTIAFTKARRVTELIHTWLVQQVPELRSRVAPYRAGYLPEERRALERRLADGDLSAVIATSALELGIDVGGLDACVLVGYPGSLISSWQRIGRVGRRGAGLVVLVAMPDALDQYVIHHPDLFFGRRFERAVLDPWNPQIAGQHLVCAAAEDPLRRPELERRGERGLAATEALTAEGRLVQDAAGTTWFSFRRRPHRDVSPRSAGRPFLIVGRGPRGEKKEKILGRIDGVRVWHECHPGAIYLHGGQAYHVLELDEERRRVVVEPVRADYYTVVLAEKETEILERLARRALGEFFVGYGRLKVTVRIRGYQKRRLFGGDPLSSHPLDVPPIVYETVGFWIELPAGMPAAFAARDLHFMGGIHAAEHAIIGLFPLLAIADRGDVGGISYTGHPQLGSPAVFIYDGVPGGAGLAEQGFRDLEALVARTLELVGECPCTDGCPCCIQSPNCGNGNKPLDKQAALLVLRAWVGNERLQSLGVEPGPDRAPAPLPTFEASRPAVDRDASVPRKHGVTRAGNVEPAPRPDAPVAVAPHPAGGPGPATAAGRTVIFDLETQRSAEEVGGWSHTSRMGLALAVLHDLHHDVWRTYFEADVHRLLLDLVMADRVVGFNIDRFDLAVLSGYSDWDLSRIRTVDLMREIERRLGFRLSLNHLSEANLGEGKAGDGTQSLAWWKQGRVDLIEHYCRKDVELTRRLYELGRSRGYLLYRDHADRTVRVPVRW